jgi:hypothetical protein
LDSYAGRVCEVLAANSEPAIVVGHSMGGIRNARSGTMSRTCRGARIRGGILAKGRAESPFDPGMAASPLNIGDFGPDDVLLVGATFLKK